MSAQERGGPGSQRRSDTGPEGQLEDDLDPQVSQIDGRTVAEFAQMPNPRPDEQVEWLHVLTSELGALEDATPTLLVKLARFGSYAGFWRLDRVVDMTVPHRRYAVEGRLQQLARRFTRDHVFEIASWELPPMAEVLRYDEAQTVNPYELPAGDTCEDADERAAIEFLRGHCAEGWRLSAIPVDGGRPATRYFSSDQTRELAAWLEKNRDRNVYFHVNPGRVEGNARLKEEDVSALTHLHVDLDPPKEGGTLLQHQDRIWELIHNLPNGVQPPTAATFSGGGYQLFWKLREPLPLEGDAYLEAKLYSKRLEELLGGDNCHNVDRLMRLPGTLNHPNAKKRGAGRTKARAEFVWQDATCVYDLGEFQKAEPGQKPATEAAPAIDVDVANVKRLEHVDDLGPDVPDQCKQIIAQGGDPDDPQRWESRSEAVFYVTCQLVRSGVPDETIYSVLTDPKFRIAESVLDKGRRAEKYALRQIKQAKEAADSEFATNEHGHPHQTIRNFRIGIRKLGVHLEYDEFSDRVNVTGLEDLGPILDDAGVMRLWLELEERFSLKPSKEKLYALVQDMARRHALHPVRDYLDALRWDGVDRLDGWLSTYLGAEDTEYTRAVGTLVLVAAVRRVRQPGCKFDEMVVLEGPQGSSKSTALRVLATRQEWFTDDLQLSAGAQRFMEDTGGKWIIEAGELKGMRKGDVDALKSTLSRQVDQARMAYGRLKEERPRQFIIVGTTNSSQYLLDNTGNRRFWPVRTGEIDVAALTRDRDQLWAEAARRESQGESIRLDPKHYEAATREQEERHVEDPIFERLEGALGDFHDCKIRTDDAWDLAGVPASIRQQAHNARLGEAMRRLGWTRSKRRFGAAPEWAYVKGSGATTVVVEGSRARLDEPMPF